MLYYLFTWISPLKKRSVAACAQRMFSESFSIHLYENPEHFNSGYFDQNSCKPIVSTPFFCKQNFDYQNNIGNLYTENLP